MRPKRQVIEYLEYPSLDTFVNAFKVARDDEYNEVFGERFRNGESNLSDLELAKKRVDACVLKWGEVLWQLETMEANDLRTDFKEICDKFEKGLKGKQIDG